MRVDSEDADSYEDAPENGATSDLGLTRGLQTGGARTVERSGHRTW
jgi:hypothetical protein